jgi:hypothetical protein
MHLPVVLEDTSASRRCPCCLLRMEEDKEVPGRRGRERRCHGWRERGRRCREWWGRRRICRSRLPVLM